MKNKLSLKDYKEFENLYKVTTSIMKFYQLCQTIETADLSLEETSKKNFLLTLDVEKEIYERWRKEIAKLFQIEDYIDEKLRYNLDPDEKRNDFQEMVYHRILKKIREILDPELENEEVIVIWQDSPLIGSKNLFLANVLYGDVPINLSKNTGDNSKMVYNLSDDDEELLEKVEDIKEKMQRLELENKEMQEIEEDLDELQEMMLNNYYESQEVPDVEEKLEEILNIELHRKYTTIINDPLTYPISKAARKEIIKRKYHEIILNSKLEERFVTEELLEKTYMTVNPYLEIYEILPYVIPKEECVEIQTQWESNIRERIMQTKHALEKKLDPASRYLIEAKLEILKTFISKAKIEQFEEYYKCSKIYRKQKM